MPAGPAAVPHEVGSRSDWPSPRSPSARRLWARTRTTSWNGLGPSSSGSPTRSGVGQAILDRLSTLAAERASRGEIRLEATGALLAETRGLIDRARARHETLSARLASRARELFMQGPAAGVAFVPGAFAVGQGTDVIEAAEHVEPSLLRHRPRLDQIIEGPPVLARLHADPHPVHFCSDLYGWPPRARRGHHHPIMPARRTLSWRDRNWPVPHPSHGEYRDRTHASAQPTPGQSLIGSY